MSASDHLNIQLFHGTNAPLKVGDIVEPAGDIGSPWADVVPDVGDWAFATYRPDFAEMYATQAHHEDLLGIDDESRPRVFRVEPVLSMEDDPHETASKRAKDGFRVIAPHSEAEEDEDSYGGFGRTFRKIQ